VANLAGKPQNLVSFGSALRVNLASCGFADFLRVVAYNFAVFKTLTGLILQV
jgi:hypothetical protein